MEMGEGVRLYNGCPDSALLASMLEKQATKDRLTAAGFTVTYFPVEERWMGFKDYKPVSAFHPTVQGVAHELLGVAVSAVCPRGRNLIRACSPRGTSRIAATLEGCRRLANRQRCASSTMDTEIDKWRSENDN
jgi:hypothetical protein